MSKKSLKVSPWLLLGICACSMSACSDNQSPSSSPDTSQPGMGTSWQWQLSGPINTSYDVDLYDIDLFDTPVETIQSLQANGKSVICYFSAGTCENFRTDAGQFPDAVKGEALEDFSDEQWLDIRDASVLEVMKTRLDLAQSKGCDGVEPDNVDGYANNTGFSLTAEDQLSYNQSLALEAHNRGLAVGLKNDLDQLEALVAYFDFAVNEQCHEYNECERLAVFTQAGKPVFNAEYQDTYINSSTARASVCADSAKLGIQTLFLPFDLDDSFRLDCSD